MTARRRYPTTPRQAPTARRGASVCVVQLDPRRRCPVCWLSMPVAFLAVGMRTHPCCSEARP